MSAPARHLRAATRHRRPIALTDATDDASEVAA